MQTKNSRILIKNVYYMLTYAFQYAEKSVYKEISLEKFDDVHNLFASILVKGINMQLKQGLYREYINCKQNINILRGKVDMQNTIKNKIARKQLLACEYDELSENNILNQILKTTIWLLLRDQKVNNDHKNMLKKQMLFLQNIDIVDLALVKWQRLKFSRNNKNYRILISICQMIFEGLLLTTNKGKYKFNSFIDENSMCKLYEKFILEYYRKHYPKLCPKSKQIKWCIDDGIGTMLPNMQSDIMLQYKNTILIIDAKYYEHTTQQYYNKNSIHSANFYQIFAYVKNEKENKIIQEPFCEYEISGVLLYAKTIDEIQPDITYSMSGNKISVLTLNLNVEFNKISEQLDKIAQNYLPKIEKVN